MNLDMHISYQTRCKIAVKAMKKKINFVSQSSDDELLLLLLSVLVELKWDLLVEISKEASAPLLSSS